MRKTLRSYKPKAGSLTKQLKCDNQAAALFSPLLQIQLDLVDFLAWLAQRRGGSWWALSSSEIYSLPLPLS